jgi:hypothetical protein
MTAMAGGDDIGAGDLPEPLTPPDCDLRDFGRIMIDIGRLFGSSFNAKASRNPIAWMIGHKLWYRSWHQMPAASLPDDDDELCYLAELGFDRVTWDNARDLAMHGWIKCSDGRLYHRVVADEALQAWGRKLKKRHLTYCATIRKHNERHPDDKREAPNFEQWEGLGRPERVTEMSRVTAGTRSRASHAKKPSKGQGQGQGQGQSNNKIPSVGAAKRGARLPDDFAMPEDWVEAAIGKGLPRSDALREADKFALYWQAKSGKDATKIDWRKTWLNWVLNADKRRGRNFDGAGKEYLGV